MLFMSLKTYTKKIKKNINGIKVLSLDFLGYLYTKQQLIFINFCFWNFFVETIRVRNNTKTLV